VGSSNLNSGHRCRSARAPVHRARAATRHLGIRGPRRLPDRRTPETDAIMWLMRPEQPGDALPPHTRARQAQPDLPPCRPLATCCAPRLPCPP
jgi:hypothetical protein